MLLDIEGTTCPVSFVGEVLFPYAKQQMPAFLADQAENPIVQEVLIQVFEAWDKDTDIEAAALRQRYCQNDSLAAVSYLGWLIEKDRKLTPLKELQGLIWRQGYDQGLLKAPLYADVPEALERWHSAGLELSTYSSGSINAQKLLYRHSSYGDLSILFRSWFDTNIGSKVSSQSYTKIAEALKSSPEQIVFISDRKSELIAAAEAGVKVLFSQRVDNPETDNGNFIAVKNYADLDLKLI
ncbi:MAG: acireductone synthase [Cyanobacteriota bacterium]